MAQRLQASFSEVNILNRGRPQFHTLLPTILSFCFLFQYVNPVPMTARPPQGEGALDAATAQT